MRLRPTFEFGRPIVLGSEPVTIGRHPENVVCLRDEKASRFHCVVEPGPDGVVRVRDLDSRNGTKVNGSRVTEQALSPGDVLKVGDHEFVLEAIGEAGDGPSGSEERAAPAGAGDADGADVVGTAVKESRKGRSRRAGAAGAASAWAQELQRLLDALPPKDAPAEEARLIDATGRTTAVLGEPGEGPLAMRLLIRTASKARATDIHVEPKGEASQVRMRVDGQMVWIAELPARTGDLAVGVVKAACHMKPAARDAMMDGHFSVRFADRRVDYRVSLTPSVHGQKMVLRVLDQRDVPHSLGELGLAGYMTDRVRQVLSKDAGMLLVCGPTGSGKTTTLYNCLREVDRTAHNVVTIEDPVEYALEGVTQIPIDEQKGNTFGGLLRSVLRQDPDVIFVGEIRDEETARTAMQAAMTGHLVFSTVHAKDTIAAVFRLLDLKIEPYLVANSMDVILAQRLVRVLCESCKTPVPVTPGQATRMGRFLGGKTELYGATGCARCLRTGYRGRRAIYELLDFNDDLRDVVLRTPTIQEMRRVIEQGLFTTLAQSGWRLAAEGVTSLDEVDHVAGSG